MLKPKINNIKENQVTLSMDMPLILQKLMMMN